MLTIPINVPVDTPTDLLVWATQTRVGGDNFFYSYISDDDGSTWDETLWHTAIGGGAGGVYYDIAYNGENFVVLEKVNNTPLYGISYSDDGGVSYQASSGTDIGTLQFWSVCWNENVFCAVSKTSTNKVLTSPDGATWTTQTFPSTFARIGVAYNGTVLCATGTNAGVAKSSVSSDDGVSWTDYTMAAAGFIAGKVKWNGTVFCCIANGTNTNVCYTSPDGQTWTARTISATKQWDSIWWDGTNFVIVALLDGWSATSPDGITWTDANAGFLGSISHPVGVSNGTNSCTVDNSDPTKVDLSSDGLSWNLVSVGGSFNGASGVVGTTKLFFGTY